MTNTPHDDAPDSTLALLHEGYPAMHRRHQRLGSEVFGLRLMGQPALCLHGEQAARIFYDDELMQRTGAVPRRIQTTLMGQHGVQTLDDEPHYYRKAMFMRLMTPGSLHRFQRLLADCWQAALGRWETLAEVVLMRETERVLCRAACAWAGVPFEEKDIEPLARDLACIIDAFGGVGTRHGQGKAARGRAEKWTRRLIEQVRAAQFSPPDDRALSVVAWHRDLHGRLLSPQRAAVELLNLLRPIVAIGRYVAFTALALHEHPEYVPRLQAGSDLYREMFVQEVRRFYPFTPLLGALVRKDFEWRGHQFRKGTMVLLDVYGMLHDARQWPEPGQFRPERFRDWDGSAYNFPPQGGGPYATGHRCAGEWLTIEALKIALGFLVTGMRYEVPPQDLRYDLTRMPTAPASGFVIRQVRTTGQAVPLGTGPDTTAARAAPVAAAARAAGCPFHQG